MVLEAAQASQEVRSLAFRSGTALEGLGAEVGECIGGADVGPGWLSGGADHCDAGVKAMFV